MKISFKIPDEKITKRFDELFPVQNCFIEVTPGNVILPKKYIEIAEDIKKLKIYEDDVWLISYPRTGSTWAQEMIWLLGNKLNYDGAKKLQQQRSPLVELSALFAQDHDHWVSNSIGNTLNCVRNMSRPRFSRSHLPWQLLPAEFETVRPKIIYTARNPKDLCVSFFHYCKLIHGLKGSFDDFCKLFLEDRSPIGSYWQHVLPLWERRHHSNILFLKYEDMKRNLPRIVKKCAKFLQIDYTLSDDDLLNIYDHLKFDKMQTNPAVNLEPMINDPQNNISKGGKCRNGKFIRKGEIGDWKNYISSDMNKQFDEWIERNSRGTGLIFEYE